MMSVIHTRGVWFSVIVTIRFTSHRVGTGVQKTTTPPAGHHEANQVSRVQERWGVREMQGGWNRHRTRLRRSKTAGSCTRPHERAMRSDGGRGGLFRPTTSVAAAFGAPVAVGVLRNGLLPASG